MTPQETEPKLPAHAGGFLEAWVSRAATGPRALESPHWRKPSWDSLLAYHRACSAAGVAAREALRPKADEKPQQDGRRGGFTLRIKPHTRQRRSEGSKRPCAQQDPQRLSQTCL